jgi:hypothetical protein
MAVEQQKQKTKKDLKEDKPLKAEIERIKQLQQKLEQSQVITNEVMKMEFTI